MKIRKSLYVIGYLFCLFLLVATLIPNPSFVGRYGEFLGWGNFTLFGYFSYFIPFYLFFIVYTLEKGKWTHFFETIFAILIGGIGFLILQSVLFKVGEFGNIFVSVMQPFIGIVGLLLLVLSIMVLALFIGKVEISHFFKSTKIKDMLNNNLEMENWEKMGDKTEDKNSFDEEIKDEIIDEKKRVEEYIQNQLKDLQCIDEGSNIKIIKKEELEKQDNGKEEEIEEKIEEENGEKEEIKTEKEIKTEIELKPEVKTAPEIEPEPELEIIEKESKIEPEIENTKQNNILDEKVDEIGEEIEIANFDEFSDLIDDEICVPESDLIVKDKEEIQKKEEVIEERGIKIPTEEIQEEKVEQKVEIEIKNEGENKVQIVKELSENSELLKSLEKGSAEKPKDFQLPSLEFLKEPPKCERQINEEEIDKKVQLLLNKLKNFKIEGDVVRTYSGPVVTTFEFKPLAHIKVSKILNLQDDLAMALKATTIRIQAPIPGKDVVGIEIPNEEIETIYLREILEDEVFKNTKSPLAIALGKDIVGNPFVTDLAKLPHLLIAGTTGSGKSVGINAMILSLLYRNSPDDLKFMMIDPKMLEFSIYNEIPHLLTPVITDPKKAIAGLSSMVKEMERRYKLMSQGKVKNIVNYNEKFPEDKMPYIVVVIDELADLMMTGGKDVEYSIARLAQMARASGIHLIVATQRPSVDVVTGTIKANLPSRISFKVGQKIDSKVILDTFGAESLLGRGDMLFTPPGISSLVRLHAPFTTEEEIETIVEFLKSQRSADYDEKFLDENVGDGISNDIADRDELFEEAKQIVLNDNKTSISYLQRKLQIGYNRAANIIEQLEIAGVLSAPNSKGQREIL